MTRLVAAVTRRLGIHVWRLFTRPLGRRAQAPPANIELRFVTGEDAQVWDDPSLGLSAVKAAEAFARGDVCVGAFEGARLVGYAWFATQPAPHVDGLWMGFADDAVYIYRAFVHPQYRGRHIAPALYCFADTLFLEKGKAYAVICVSVYNAASIGAARRIGAKDAGYAAYWNPGRWFFSARTSGARAFGFRFFRP